MTMAHMDYLVWSNLSKIVLFKLLVTQMGEERLGYLLTIQYSRPFMQGDSGWVIISVNGRREYFVFSES